MKNYEHLRAQCFMRRPSDLRFKENIPRMLYICKISPEVSKKYSRVMHSHENLIEIVLIYSGSSTYMIDGKMIDVKKGDLLIYNQGIVHDEMVFPKNQIGFFCIGIENLLLTRRGKNELTTKKLGYRFETGEEFDDLYSLYEMIYQNLAKEKANAENFCNDLAMALLEKAITVVGSGNNGKTDAEDLVDNAELLSRKVKEYIDEHYKEPVTVNDIGKALYLSPYYVAHIFKENSGYSPIQYLIRRRIGEAQTLLITTDMPIAQIALEVGFDNQSYFSIQFTKNVGMPPMKFRKNYVIP